MQTLWQQILIFAIVFLFFAPLVNKTVRLASDTWDARDEISDERKREVFLLLPSALLLAFVFVYIITNALFNMLVF